MPEQFTFTYRHVTTGEDRQFTGIPLNAARRQLDAAEWRLVDCRDQHGTVVWTAEAVGLTF